MTIEERLLLIKYYEIYKELFTDKKKQMFEDYYLEDLSINEIADDYKITKNAVYNSIKDTEKKLYNLEQLLQINSKYEHNIKLLKDSKVSETIIKKIK